MSGLIDLKIDDRVATITMNDGKANIMSITMLDALASAVAKAKEAGAIVLLKSGLERTFSAGFDVKLLASSDRETSLKMLQAGAGLILSLLQHPFPVISVCAGHAFPMGAFLLLASDVRIGVRGAYRIGLNEVTIGIAVPDFALELCRSRVPPTQLYRTAALGQMFDPAEAVAAGFLDALVAPEAVDETLSAITSQMLAIDHPAHASTKVRLRKGAISVVERAAFGDVVAA